jgi:hypothetical protein
VAAAKMAAGKKFTPIALCRLHPAPDVLGCRSNGALGFSRRFRLQPAQKRRGSKKAQV